MRMLVSVALIAHEYAWLDGAQLPPRLGDLWRNLGPALDIQPTGPVALPDASGVPADHLTVVGTAARPPAGNSYYQAMVATAGDAAVVTALLAPNDGSTTWQDLDAQWRHVCDVAAGPTQLGGALVYVGLVNGAVDADTIDALGAELRRAVPAADLPGWTRRCSLTADGFLLWEAPSTRTGQRRLVLVGPRDREDELDNFSWTPGGAELGPFVHYLLVAARSRYLAELHDTSRERVSTLRRDLDRAVDRLLELHHRASSAPAQLAPAEVVLTGLQAGSTGVITTLARLRVVARGTVATAANFRLAAPAHPLQPGDGPLTADLATVELLGERVADDIAYLEIARDRAERVAAVTAAAIQRGLSTHQQQLLLVQSSLVGAILMVLAGVQAFGAKLPMPASLQLPLIMSLGGLALMLPTSVLRWSRNVPGDLPLRSFDYLTTCLFGSSVGWFAAEVISRRSTGHVSALGWTWLAVAAGGAVAFLGARLWFRRLDRLRSHDVRPGPGGKPSDAWLGLDGLSGCGVRVGRSTYSGSDAGREGAGSGRVQRT